MSNKTENIKISVNWSQIATSCKIMKEMLNSRSGLQKDSGTELL